MIRRFRAWRRRRAYHVQCEVCGASVRPRDAVEVTAAFGTAYLPGEGGSVTATYCKQHAPIEGA